MALVNYKLLVALLNLYVMLTSFTNDATCLKGNYCAKRYVNGRWISVGNCERMTKHQKIANDLNLLEKVEKNPRSEIRPCQSTHFKFLTKSHRDYVWYNGTVPQLKPFTACVWLRPEEIGVADSYGVMSYCTIGSKDCETLLISLSHFRTTVTINDERERPYRFLYTIKARQWTYLCIVMSDSVSQYYINGTQLSSNMATINNDISKGGVLILGNAQRSQMNGSSPGEPIDGAHGFFGEMREFQLWNKQLSGKNIDDVFKSGGCSCGGDSVVNFNKRNSVIKGNVKTFWKIPCP